MVGTTASTKTAAQGALGARHRRAAGVFALLLAAGAAGYLLAGAAGAPPAARRLCAIQVRW
jgi:hypothetical protein